MGVIKGDTRSLDSSSHGDCLEVLLRNREFPVSRLEIRGASCLCWACLYLGIGSHEGMILYIFPNIISI